MIRSEGELFRRGTRKPTGLFLVGMWLVLGAIALAEGAWVVLSFLRPGRRRMARQRAGSSCS